MARLGFVDQEGNVSHITSSYTPKKKKKEEEAKINDNKSTDIRTIKTGKNLIDDAKIIKKGVDTGIISGLTGVADAPFQAAQEEIQKGKNIKNEKELLKDAALGILRASSPLANSILGNRETSNEIKKTLKDKNKSTLEKIVNSGLAVIGNEASDNTYQGAKSALRIGGAINPNLDKTVSNIQSFIDKPAETKQQELSQEIQNYSSPVQFLTTAGQTIGNMLPSIGATAITKDPSAGLSLMGVSAKGQATKEALQNGADITQANRIGTAKGLLEAGTELATGGLNIFGKGALDDITTDFINNKIGSKGLNFLAKQIAGVGGEIGEELVSDVVGTLIDRGTIDPNADYSSKEAQETILQTIATTLLLNGLTGGYTPRAYRQNAIEMQESRQNNGNVLNNNDTVIPDTNQVREVNEIQQKVENGEITYEEANQQMEQVQNGTYQQNQNNEVVIQEAQKQFDAINQAEANGIMDSETANQERQAIINTMNQMQQDTNTQENESYEPQEVEEEKRQSPIDKLSDEEKEQLKTIYQKQANREKITDQDRKTLEYFTRKTNDLKNPELNKNITKYDDVKSGYKYVKNFDESKFDSKMVDKAKEIVSANKQGRRTKQQWLDVAKNIGMQADNLDSKALEKLAFESWAYTRPNQRGVLNRQGAPKVDFQIHEWVKAIYEGARVGERIESRVESPKIQVNQEKTQTKEVETKKVETKKQNTPKQLKPTNTEDKIQNFRNSVENENIKDKDGFYKAVEKIIKDKDYNVILDSSITNGKGQSVNALITNDNGVTIKINPKSERAGEILLMHEVTHGIETKEMRNLILDYAKKNSEFNDALENLKEIYGTEDVTPEVVADISGQLLGNQEFINSLSVEKPTLFKRILNALTSLKNKLTGNSKYENFVKDLEVKYREAYRKANQDTANQNLKNATKYSQNAEITDNKGRPLNINMQNYMEDSQATDAKGRLVTLYHTTTDMIKQFNEFDPANKYDPSQYKFGKYNVTYLTDSEEMSESYSMYDPRKADTRRLNSIKEAEDYLENTSLRLVDIENTNQAIKNHFKDNDNRYFLVGGDLTTFGEYKTEKELLRDVIPTAQQVMRGNSNFKYEVYANITKPYIIDAEGNNWDKVAREINQESKKVVDSLTNEQKEELSKYANESLDEWQKWHMSNDYLEYKRYDDVFKNLNQEEQENLIIMSMKDNFTPQDYVDAYNEYGKDFNMKDPNSKIELNPYGEVKMQRSYKDFVAEWCRLEAEAAKYENKDSYFLSKTNKKYNQQLRAVGADKMFDMAKYNFKDWAVEDTLSSDLKTNDIVKKVIEMNENGEDYDGIIIKNTTDYGVRSGDEPHDVYVVFNSNQIKSVDNPDPTSDPDIRYSKKAKKWQEFLDKNFKERGTRTYFKDNGVSEKGAKFLSEMPKPDKLSVRERIKQGKARRAEQWAWFKRNVVDKGEAIYKLAKELKNPLLYAKYDKRGTTTGEANYDIGEGQTNLKGKKYKNFKYVDKNGKVVRTGPMSLNQIWEGIDPTLGNEYIGHWLNVDRYKQTSSEGKKIIAQLEADVKAGKMTKQEMEEELKNYNTNRYVISPNFTDEMSKKKIAELEEAHPELKVFGENVWQYGKNQLQNMLDAGMISEQQAKQWQKETPHYVRLQRNIPNNAQSTIVFDDKGNARVSNQIKEFKGSTLDVLPFKDSMAAYTLDVRNSIRENAFAQELAKALGVSSNNQEITDINDIMGFNPELLDNGNGTYSLTFLNKGAPTTMPITQGIYEALQPNKHYEFENKPFFEGVRKVDSIRKALLTDKNPMFLATNMMKDLFDAPLNSKYPVLFAKNYPKAIWQVVKNGELYQQYKALGGLQNTYFEKSDGFKKPSKLDVIGRMNNAIEQFPRVAEFMSTMEKTGDVDQAMYNAAEITTNFKRGGDVAKAINRNGFTFLNASIQGFSKQIRNFTDISNPKEATKMLLKALILGVAPALINDAGWGDDEDYQELQDYQKDRYYIIGKTKDGTFIRIPKGRAVSVFQSAARRTKYALGGDKKAFNGFVKFAQDQVAPNNPLDNNLVSPLVNVYRNTSWSGNDIIPQSMMEYTKTEDQFNEKTDVVSRKIGKALGKLPELPEGFENFKSPMGINYLIDQYSGALGDITLPYITPKASSKTTNPILKPIRDKFTGDFAYSNKNVNTFYEVQKELKKKSDTPVEDAKSSYMISQGKELSKLYTKQREIQNNNKLSKSEKYEKAREVQKEINEFAKKSVKDINSVDENKYYLKIGDKYFKRIIKDGEEQYVVDTSKKIPTEKYALYDYFKSKYEKSKEKKK